MMHEEYLEKLTNAGVKKLPNYLDYTTKIEPVYSVHPIIENLPVKEQKETMITLYKIGGIKMFERLLEEVTFIKNSQNEIDSQLEHQKRLEDSLDEQRVYVKKLQQKQKEMIQRMNEDFNVR